uniref:Integrase catalytic domain-containing protein n=1 Tax=Fagus sylvatica TaxID=28930 RepID=A0A2N9HTD2_FAGSY
MSRSAPVPPKPTEIPARQVPGPSRPEVSIESSYRPFEHTLLVTSVIPSSRHTDLRHHLDDRRIGRHEQTSTEEISDLKKAARGMSPAKERPRRRLQKSDREKSGTSLSAHTEDWAETPSLKRKATNSADPSVTVRATREGNECSDKGVSERLDRSALPFIVPKKKVRQGEQGAVWKALDLVSSSPFSEEIEQAKLPERFTAPRLEVYNGRTDPVAHIVWEKWHSGGSISLSEEQSALGPFFVWPPKLAGDPAAWNHNLHCLYHRDKGHLIENCHKYKTHLEQLVVDGHLFDYVDSNLTEYKPRGTTANRSGTLGSAPAGIIHVIHNPSCTSILSTSFRSDIQKAAHLRRSFGIMDYAHLLSTSCLGNPGSSAHQVVSVLVDQGSFAEVMYKGLYEKLGLKEADLDNFSSPVFGFSGESTIPLGKTTFLVSVGPINLQTEFIVIHGFSPYNAIMGRDWLHWMKAVPSTLHQKLRFPTEDGIMEVNGDQVAAKQCVLAAINRKGTNLSLADREKLVALLMELRDIFAWSVYEAPGVSPDLACHSLNISSEAKLVSQKRRKLAPEWAEIVAKEVDQLLEANAIRPVQYPTWLSNTVVVKKKNGKWRVCVDFTDLNKACPKDPFPLPRIDQLVDSASGHERMSFLDVFQGYHQIPMTLSDQEKTAFITPKGIYYYRVMPFGLKNAGATYQRIVTGLFGHLIRKTVEVYIDDMLIKSVGKVNHIGDLREFLGHMVSYNGVEANPDQISALLNLKPPKDAKQVQRLIGMIAALGWFISQSAKKCRPFFRLLGKKRKFLWDEDCSVAFQKIKSYLSTPPCLSIPSPGEPLFLYLAISEHAVSVVLVQETHEGQKPIFFVSKTMNEMESRYLPFEKAALALIQAAKKLSHYFQASTVTVLTDLPLKVLMHSLDFSGQITRWGVHLGSLGVEYKPRTSIKGQLVVNHISGEYLAWDERMLSYFSIVMSLLSKFDFVQVEQIKRKHDSHADILAKLATALETDLYRTVTVEVLSTPSTLIDTVDRVCSTSSVASWMDPLIAYLRDDCLPEDPKAASIIKRKAPGYWLSKEGSLYKWSFSGPYLLCIHPNLGYWWPYMQSDAIRYVRKCDKCQRFAPKIHQPARELNPLSSPWPFTQWGLDIVGPLPQALGNKKFLIVATDYFTKWIEAEPLSHIREVDTKRFLWKSVITRFGIPWAVISDNGTQFEGKLFKGFCSDLVIKNFFSSPTYPQANGLAEVSNKVILDGIKKRLEEAKGRWVEELPSVMWTHRTTRRRSTWETPFALAYGVEVVIPFEVGLPTIRKTEFDAEENKCNLQKDLNLLEERRDMETIRLASYQHQMKRGYDRNIRPRSFQVGDLVLWKVVANTRNPNGGKLGPN